MGAILWGFMRQAMGLGRSRTFKKDGATILPRSERVDFLHRILENSDGLLSAGSRVNFKSENWIPRAGDGTGHMRDIKAIEGIAVHRIGAEIGGDAEEISKFLQGYDGVNGMAYTFIITPDGRIQQAQPLAAHTPHARRWNSTMIGVGCIGDFRYAPPTNMQWDAAVWLCSMILPTLRNTLLRGHTELEGGTAHPGKECPGEFWDMKKMRAEVGAHIRSQKDQRFFEIGVVP